ADCAQVQRPRDRRRSQPRALEKKALLKPACRDQKQADLYERPLPADDRQKTGRGQYLPYSKVEIREHCVGWSDTCAIGTRQTQAGYTADPRHGLAALKLSNTAVPGGLASVCHVPAFISNITPDIDIELLHGSLYIALQLPGTPPPSVATSNITLPLVPSCLIRIYFSLDPLYAPLNSTAFDPPAFLCTTRFPDSIYIR